MMEQRPGERTNSGPQEIADWLRNSVPTGFHADKFIEAADTIESLQAEVERLRAAIETFLSHVPVDENTAAMLGAPIAPLAEALRE